MGILSHQCLILATYSPLRRIKKYSVVLGVSLFVWGLFWGSPGAKVCEIAPLDTAQEGQDQGRVVGGDTGPSVPHTDGSKGKYKK